MLKIISSKKYDEMKEKLKRLELMERRISQLYWFSEFPFMAKLQKWLATGKTETHYNVYVGEIRDTFRREFGQYFKNEIQKLKKENESIVRENTTLKEAIRIKEREGSENVE